MSETIDYFGEAKSFKSKKEKEEFIRLAKSWQEAVVNEYGKIVRIEVVNGWRGGGASCEELVAKHFKEWLDKHKHIKFYMNATYIEHAPTDTVFGKQF